MRRLSKLVTLSVILTVITWSSISIPTSIRGDVYPIISHHHHVRRTSPSPSSNGKVETTTEDTAEVVKYIRQREGDCTKVKGDTDCRRLLQRPYRSRRWRRKGVRSSSSIEPIERDLKGNKISDTENVVDNQHNDEDTDADKNGDDHDDTKNDGDNTENENEDHTKQVDVEDKDDGDKNDKDIDDTEDKQDVDDANDGVVDVINNDGDEQDTNDNENSDQNSNNNDNKGKDKDDNNDDAEDDAEDPSPIVDEVLPSNEDGKDRNDKEDSKDDDKDEKEDNSTDDVNDDEKVEDDDTAQPALPSPVPSSPSNSVTTSPMTTSPDSQDSKDKDTNEEKDSDKEEKHSEDEISNDPDDVDDEQIDYFDDEEEGADDDDETDDDDDENDDDDIDDNDDQIQDDSSDSHTITDDDTGDDCIDDIIFYYDNKEWQTCSWMAMHDKCERDHEGHSVATYWCPKSCNQCNNIEPSPPTNPPTLHTVTQPTIQIPDNANQPITSIVNLVVIELPELSIDISMDDTSQPDHEGLETFFGLFVDDILHEMVMYEIINMTETTTIDVSPDNTERAPSRQPIPRFAIYDSILELNVDVLPIWFVYNSRSRTHRSSSGGGDGGGTKNATPSSGTTSTRLSIHGLARFLVSQSSPATTTTKSEHESATASNPMFDPVILHMHFKKGVEQYLSGLGVEELERSLHEDGGLYNPDVISVHVNRDTLSLSNGEGEEQNDNASGNFDDITIDMNGTIVSGSGSQNQDPSDTADNGSRGNKTAAIAMCLILVVLFIPVIAIAIHRHGRKRGLNRYDGEEESHARSEESDMVKQKDMIEQR